MELKHEFTRAKPPPLNSLQLGDCVDVMGRMPANSVNLILTDPPYLARYKDSEGRTVRNYDRDAWLKPAFAGMYRVLQPNAFAICSSKAIPPVPPPPFPTSSTCPIAATACIRRRSRSPYWSR